MTDIAAGLVARLKATTDVVNLVKSSIAGSTCGIYPDVLPQDAVTWNSTSPAIVYNLIWAGGQHHSKASSGLVNSVYQIDCYALSRASAVTLSEQVRHSLDGHRGAMGSERAHSCRLVSRSDDYEPPSDKSDTGRYRVSIDVRIWYGEDLPNLGST